MPAERRRGCRVLVAGAGNVLRGDDGFGVAVVRELEAGEPLPAGVDLIETGIGGMSMLQQILDGYDALVVVDALDSGNPPGTVVVLEPEAEEPSGEDLSSLHLAEPSVVLRLAGALGVLPPRTYLVGCQPEDCSLRVERLSPAVARAVGTAAETVRDLVGAVSRGGP